MIKYFKILKLTILVLCCALRRQKELVYCVSCLSFNLKNTKYLILTAVS